MVTTTVPTTSQPETDEHWWQGLRSLLLRLHTYAGIFIAPFVFLAGLSGLLYVFTPHIDQLVYQHELHVPAAASTVGLSTQVDAARAKLPGATVYDVRPAPSATDTTQVAFEAPDLSDDHYRTVFVNPHDGAVRGTLTTSRSAQDLPVQGFFDQLHKNLLLGQPGRMYSELAASWLWVLVLGGAALWFGRRVARSRRAASGRRRLLNWHGWIGVSIGVALLFLSATGMTWSTFAGDNISKLRAALSWTTPEASPDLPAHGGGDVGFDRVLRAAHSAGLHAPLSITPPTGPGTAYTVERSLDAWPATVDTVAIDPANGAIADKVGWDQYPFMAKLTHRVIELHEGALFGWVNQILLAAVAVALLTTIALGYRMWWLRGPAKRGFGRLPRRGTWRRVPGKVLAPLILFALFAGCFAPLLGGSLLVFLIADQVLAARARRKAVHA